MNGALDARIVVRYAGLAADIRVAAGEVVAIMGPSGAGKTSLLETIAGLVRLDDGYIDVDGTRLAGEGLHTPPSRRSIGLLGQDALLFPHMTAAENIAFAARTSGYDREESRRRATEWLDRIGLAGFDSRRPDELSGGQRQRIALARALAASPRLLLLDEPFTSLDVEAAAQLRAVVREQRGDTTMILISHSILDAKALAGRLIILESGQIVQDDAVPDVLAVPATPFAAAVAESAR